ncbi:hypothetical protein ACHAWF_004039 [Thalassiosira exigua]
MVSVFIRHESPGQVKVMYEIIARDVHYNPLRPRIPFRDMHGDSDWGWINFARRSKIETSLVKGSLVLEVRMKSPEQTSLPFVPHNPFCEKMLGAFLDEASADVLFQVSEEPKGRKTRRSSSKMPRVSFHAHKVVLRMCAPLLAKECEQDSDEGLVHVPITGVKPDIFRIILYFIYGGSLAGDLKAHCKDLIDIADRYGVVHLKLLAEAYYVTSSPIQVDTMREQLLFANSKKCALLKEAVMDFIVENGAEVLENVSLKGARDPTLFADLLATVSRGKKTDAGDRFSMMRVNELRVELNKRGLDVDGTRESMIAALTNSE